MPFGPTRDLLRRLGLTLPETMPPANDALQNQVAAEAQSDWSPLKKIADQIIMSAPVEALRGFIGLDPREESGIGRAVNIGTQISQAGMPFASLMRGTPAYHGTKVVFDKFNPAKSNATDLLGRYLHFAQRPDYASRASLENLGFGAAGDRPNIIPAQVEANNVLDLVTPEWDDLSQAVAALPPDKRRGIIADYKWNRSSISPESAKKELTFALQNALNDPEVVGSVPYDAIRYDDVGNPSFAVPPTTPIRSHFSGALLNDPPKPLEVRRLPDDAPVGDLFIKGYGYHPGFGRLSKDDAKSLVLGGELPISWYEKYFND